MADVDLAPAEVFGFLADPDQACLWLAGVSGPAADGAFEVSCLGRSFRVAGTLAADQASGTVTLEGQRPFAIRLRLACRPYAGGTRLFLRAEAEPGTYFGMPERVVGAIMRRRFAADLVVLKEILEGERSLVAAAPLQILISDSS